MSKTIIKNQNDIDLQLYNEVINGDYTIDKPLIVLDPYKMSPLCAYICFKTEYETSIILTVKGKTKEADLSQTFPKKSLHILPVVGLYNNFENTILIKSYQGFEHKHTILTTNFNDIDKIILSFENNGGLEPNKLLVYASPVPWFDYVIPFGLDVNGDIRWVSSQYYNFDIKRSKFTGRLLAGTGDLVEKPYFATGLFEFDWLGKIYTFFEIETTYHHDFFEMDNGNLIILTNPRDSLTIEDSLILIDRKTGKIIKRWNYREFLNPNDCRKHGSSSELDWFHNNSVWYDNNSNSIILSSRHTDSLISLDFDTQQINWIISNPQGWNQELVDKYFLEPSGYNFTYTYGQHSVSVSDDGNINCFDNHYFGKASEDYVPAKDSFSRAVSFKIDILSRTIQTDFEYGRDLGADYFSSYISYYERMNPYKHLLHFGGLSYENGVVSNYAGPKGFERGVSMESKTLILAYGSTVLKAHLKGNYYRSRIHGINLFKYEFSTTKGIHLKSTD